MKIFIQSAFFVVFIVTNISSQNAYLSKYYPLSSTDRLTQFRDVLFIDDSLTVFGQINDDTMRWNQNAFMARFDTLGNLARIKILYHPEDLESVLPSEYSKISATKDGGYLVLLSAFDQWNKEILYKLDRNFNVQFTTSLLIGNETTLSIKALEINDDYYLATVVSLSTGNLNYGLAKVDKNGKTVWNKVYSRPDKHDYLHGIKSFKPGIITLIGSRQKDETWGLTITELDTAGNILNEIFAEKRFINLYLAIDTLSDGGYIYIAHKLTDLSDFYTYDTRIYRIDSDGKTIWERIFPSQKGNFARLSDMEKNHDGSFTISGMLFGEGLSLRISQNGEILWRHKYINSSISDTSGYFQVINATTILPEGNIIGCGTFNHHNHANGVEQGWLVKIRPDGCIDNLCKTSISTSTVATYLLSSEGGSYAYVYPNPSNGNLKIDLNINIKEASVVLFDMNGRKIMTKKLFSGSNDLKFEKQVSGFIGYIIFLESGEIIKSGKINILK